ncbi:MAG: hypothetical protein OER97_04515 [Gammaproteobacteria bacterium]|nr:hypothetical protein [Gammaproteobacteria bacterium]
MRKRHLTLLCTGIVAFLFAFATPIQAGPPETASGKWFYLPSIIDAREAGCNTFLNTFEIGLWTGTFTGDSTESGKVVIHCSGRWSFNAIVTFSSVTVDGRSGTLEMSVVGSRLDATSDWYGHWVITDGSADLENLRGQGNWWGLGFVPPTPPNLPEFGEIDYDGIYHFEPN